jgi:hypothetical protein
VLALEIKIDSLNLKPHPIRLDRRTRAQSTRLAANTSFIGFTGTPIEKTDANTRAVFGDYISIYDIQRAVADKATVAIYYESRAAKLGLNQNDLPNIDQEFEAIIEERSRRRSVWVTRIVRDRGSSRRRDSLPPTTRLRRFCVGA